MSRFASRNTAALALLGGLVGLTSCEIGKVAVAPTQPQLVVHAVLNPAAPSQLILLERTLSGAVPVEDTPFNQSDPIVSGGGIPVSDALVEIIDSAGTVFPASEDRKVFGGSLGAGVYHASMPNGLRAGSRYQLHIRTPDGEEVTGFTRVPRPDLGSTSIFTRTFNRDHDSLLVEWRPGSAVRAYTLRIETPFGPFLLFTDSLRFNLSGQLRNFFAMDLPRVFIPGFSQDLVVAAVDSNFYDYYRTTNDPFTGSGIISRLQGAVGLFGSVFVMNRGTLNVTADRTAPIEGRYLLKTVTDLESEFANSLTLYVESPPSRDGGASALSGNWAPVSSITGFGGVIGRMTGNSVSLALLGSQLAGDTVDVLVGELQGTTLVGTYRKRGGTVSFSKE